MRKKINAYVFTRPLQYTNLKNIVTENNNDFNILFVFPNFSEGYFFYEKIQEREKEWNKIVFINSKLKLIKELISNKVSHLYLSTDIGFYVLAQLLIKVSYHYEEGWGTYNKGENKKHSFKNKLLLGLYKFLGSGSHIGNSNKTNGVIVYNKELYKLKFPEYKKEVKKFPIDFKKNIENSLSFFEEVYGFKNKIKECKEKKILIYATGWKLDKNILKEINEEKSKYDKVFVKLHPHIKKVDLTQNDMELLEQNVLLEIYISQILGQGNKLTIWHDNSAAVLYYLNNIEVKNIGRTRPEYDEVFNFFRSIK